MTSANEHIATFVQARLSSIDAIKPELLRSRKRTAESNSTTFGIDEGDGPGPVKRCLRRRTRSFLAFRMPRRLKSAKLSGRKDQISSDNVKKNIPEPKNNSTTKAPMDKLSVNSEKKRLNRRSRRYIRRMRLPSFNVTRGWMPTHLWHAKRMLMQRLWGVMVPVKHSFRGASAVNNMLRRNATVQDVSFLTLVQVQHLSLEIIRGLLSEYMDPTILSIIFGDEGIISGSREYEVVLYSRKSYPNNCLGPVRIHFVPTNPCSMGSLSSTMDAKDSLIEGSALINALRNVLIWAHPSFSAELTALLKDSLASLIEIKNSPENHISERRDLCRFSIRGARSRSIIRDVFWPSNNGVDEQEKTNNRAFVDLLNSEGLNKIWGEGCALSTTCVDPRAINWGSRSRGISARLALNPLFRWKSLTHEDWESMSNDRHKVKNRMAWPSGGNSCMSAIWNNTSEEKSFEYMSDKDINQARSDMMINKTPIYQSETETGVFRSYLESNTQQLLNKEGFRFVSSKKSTLFKNFPAVFIRRCSRYAMRTVSPDALSSVPEMKWNVPDDDVSGWDVIVPSVWARTIWVALQFAGAAAIGLQEAEAIDTLSGQMSFPRDYPDTQAGSEYRNRKKTELLVLIAKRPRRITSLCVKLEQSCYPFWNDLFDEDRGSPVWIRTNSYLQPFLPPQQYSSNAKPYWKTIREGSTNNSEQGVPNQMGVFPHTLPFNTMVSVSIVTVSRGVPASGAKLFQPSAEDIASFEYYFQAKRNVDLSGVRRLGEWRGVDGGAGSRVEIGMVSSGMMCLESNRGVGVGGCNALRLYDTFRGNLMHHRVVAAAKHLVMFQNPGSRWLRPAVLSVVPMGR